MSSARPAEHVLVGLYALAAHYFLQLWSQRLHIVSIDQRHRRRPVDGSGHGLRDVVELEP